MKLYIDTTDKNHTKVKAHGLNPYEIGLCIGTVLDAFAKENGKDAEALKAKVATKIVVGLLNSNSDTSKKDCTDGVKDQKKDFGEWG